MSDNCISC